MANVLIAYFTQTGNTEKVARAIYDEVVSGGHDTKLKDIDGISAADLAKYDLVFLGSACHSSDLAKPVLKILADIPPESRLKVAGFATHSTPRPGGSERDRELYQKWASGCPKSFEVAAGETRLEFLGYFGCQGAASPPIEEFIHKTIITDEDEWQNYVSGVRKHPDTSDLEEAKEFARNVLIEYRNKCL